MTIRKRLVRDWPSGSRFHTKPGYSAGDERYDYHRRAVDQAVVGGLQWKGEECGGKGRDAAAEQARADGRLWRLTAHHGAAQRCIGVRYICSGVAMPMSDRHRERPMREASTSLSRARVSASSSEMTRQRS